MGNPLLDSPGTWQNQSPKHGIKSVGFFLMKEIRIVQVNLLGLDDPVHNMSERVALQESVNSTGKRIPLQILMGLHMHTPDRE